MKNKIAIIGHGYVGKGMCITFPDALIYDRKYDIGINETSGDIYKNPLTTPENAVDKATINKECGLAIVCVPTPPKGMGEQRVDEDEKIFREVDLSIIEETIKWLEVPLILIKSTIPPGTVDNLIAKTGKKIGFSPEYMGEGNYYTPPEYPSPTDPRQHSFLIVGGETKTVDGIFEYFKPKLGPAKTYFKCTAVEAECIKYMENTWGATKVTFVNEWYEICKKVGASYNSVREGWVLDSRVERMHTAVFENKRGFGGKCYPKDLLGIIAKAESKGYEPNLLKEVWNTNKRMLKKNQDDLSNKS